jgi:CDP-4-dehydro-6-deoxyglucose reductase
VTESCAYNVTLQPSGRCFAARDDESVLEAALRQDIVLPYGCRSGTCGMCRGQLVAGTVAYPWGEPLGLTAAERRGGYALLCQARASSDLVLEAQELTPLAELAVKTLPCRVQRMQRLAHDVMALHLKLPRVEAFRFLPGQYIDILPGEGRRRSFSLANPPHDSELLELHVRHVEGGRFTGRVFERMKEKDLLRLQGPLGTFFLREDSGYPLVLVAGGTGFAPMKSIIRHVLESGSRRPVHLYWGARTRADLYQSEQVEAWQRAYPNFRFTPVLSEEPEASDWPGRRGLVTEAVLAGEPHIYANEVYLAGPPAMVEAGRRVFADAGLPPERLYYDAFDFAADARSDRDEV